MTEKLESPSQTERASSVTTIMFKAHRAQLRSKSRSEVHTSSHLRF